MNLGEFTEMVQNAFSYAHATFEDDVRTYLNQRSLQLSRSIPHLWLLETLYELTTESGTYLYPLPDDFGQEKHFYRNTDGVTYPIILVAKEDVVRNQSTNDDYEGAPNAYFIWHSEKEIELIPKPDDEYDLRFIYYAEPRELTAVNDTHVLIEDRDSQNILLCAVLSELHEAAWREDLAARYEQKYQAGVFQLRATNMRRQLGKGGIVFKNHKYGIGRLKGRGRR